MDKILFLELKWNKKNQLSECFIFINLRINYYPLRVHDNVLFLTFSNMIDYQ